MKNRSKGHATWGVMFNDGSVMARWNGRTEKQRALAAARGYAKTYQPDRITLAYWDGEKWERHE